MRINRGIICLPLLAVFLVMITGTVIADDANVISRSQLGINTHWYNWLEPNDPNAFTLYKQEIQAFGFVRDGAWWDGLEPTDLVGSQWDDAGWNYSYKQKTLCGEIVYQSGYDNLVKQFQDPESPQLLLLLEQNNGAFPEDATYDQYYDYVFHVVERYDKDGNDDDMPGLKKPVIYFEVGNEVDYEEYGYLSPKDYVEKRLKPAYKAARDANPNAIVMCAGLGMESDLSGNNVRYFNTNLNSDFSWGIF